MVVGAFLRSVILALVALLAAGSLALPSPTLAQDAAASSAQAALEARRDALFAASLNDPSNLDLAFEYAQISAQLGDFEGAIATLERMLIYAPNLPRIQLELGVLYYRIGATDMARRYLEAAKRADAPPQVEDRVDTFIAQLDRQDRRFSIAGSAHTGLRYQSNATASPDEDIININGIPIRLDPNARAQSDGNVFGLADINISYDLRNQGDLIEANIVTYNSSFFDISRLDVNLIEAQLGPSFSFGRFGFKGARLGVYGIGGATALDRTLYTTQYGAGARLQVALGTVALFDSRNEFRVVNYTNSSSYPTVRLQTGEEFSTVNTVTASINARMIVQANAYARIISARANFKTYDEAGTSLRATRYFYLPSAGPLAGDVPWSVSLAGGALIRRYDAPDPVINAFEAEDDDALWAEIGLSAPLKYGFSVFATGQLRRQWSNYDTRDFTNAIATVGLSKRF